jgi:branched-chain amino acid transport system substrate-binding protein
MGSAKDMSIVIGMEGPANLFSADQENVGFRAALAEANQAGGIHGRRLEDRGYPRPDRAAAAANARRLIEEGVFMLLNFGAWPSSGEISRLAAEHRVPYMFPHTALLPREAQRYVFTSFPRYEAEAALMTGFLVGDRGVRRIAIVHEPNAYGRLFLDLLRAGADSRGYAFCSAVEFQAASLERDLAKLRDLSPDATFLALHPEEAKAVMQCKARLGIACTMVATGPLSDEQYLEVPGGHAEGTLGFCHFLDPEHAEGAGFDAYRAAMAAHAPGHGLNRYSVYGYVYGRLVLEGLRRAGPACSREDFVDAMESIRGWDSGGIIPPVSFSATEHHAQHAGIICELRAGRFRPQTGWVGAD